MLACSEALLDETLEGGAAAVVTRSSLFCGWTVLVVSIAPPANPSEIAAATVPTPTKKDELLKAIALSSDPMEEQRGIVCHVP
jgi:hypothetical protein